MGLPGTRSAAARDLAICIGVGLALFALSGYLDIYEKWSAWSAAHEEWELDELLVAVALSTAAFAWYSFRRWRESRRETERRIEINRKLDAEIAMREETERTLRDSDELFSRAFHASPALLAISRPEDGAHYDVNKTWMSTLGYSHEEAMAHSALELGVWADPNQRAQFVAQLKQERSVRGFDATFRTKGGQLLDFLVSGEYIESGGEVRLLVVSHDITERVAAERAQRESEKRLRQASQLAKIGDYVWDAVEDRCLYCSEQHARVHGLTPEQYIARASSLAGSFTLTHAADRAAVHEAFKRLRAGTRIDIEYRTVTAGGETRYVREVAEPVFDDSGRVVQEIGTSQDITEIKRAETLLMRAMDASSAVFALFDADDRLVVCDRKYREMYETPALPIVPGVTFADIIRTYAAERGVGESEAETDSWLAKRLDRRQAPARCYEYQRGDGHWIEVSDCVLEDDSILMIGLIVTERKQLESALRQREAYLNAFVAHASAEIAIKDPEGRYVLINPEAGTHLGVSLEQAVGKTSHDVFPEDVAHQIVAHDRQVLASGKPRKQEIFVDSPDGPHVYSAVKFPIYDTDGRLLGLGAVGTDITESKRTEERLRESEERFRGFVEHLPLSIVLKDPDGKFVLVNEIFETRYELTMAEVLGRTDHDLHPKETADLYAQQDREVLDGGKAVIREFQTSFADGTVHCVNVTKFPIKDSRGRISGIGSISQDITERKQVEEQLRQAQKMEALGQLTGGVAHDFNNMLAAIIGNLEILGDYIDADSAGKRSLDVAFRAALNAAELTSRLLSFSRQQHLEHAVIDLREATTDMRGLLRATLGKAIELILRVPEETRSVWADRVQLESAIINLAANARDAMPNGGRLTIEASNADFDARYAAQHPDIAPGPYVVLAISDTGSGMPPHVRARVFEPFFTTKDVGKGTGLGLSTVFGFMKQLGGHVTLYSEEGHGTCVKLYLPAGASAQAETSAAPATPGALQRGPETVLVVESDANLGQTATVLLENLGYRVLLAANGPAALSLLHRHPEVDLLFTDTLMTRCMSGFELAREALERYPRLKVLHTSGDSNGGPERDPSSEADIEWIAKPYLQSALAEKIRRVLDTPRAVNGAGP